MTAKPGRGGARPGAGRKPKHADPAPAADDPPLIADDSIDLLRRIVTGEFKAPLSLRAECARTLIRYEREVARGPIPSPPAKEMQKRQAADAQRANDAAWAAKREAIIAEHVARKRAKESKT